MAKKAVKRAQLPNYATKTCMGWAVQNLDGNIYAWRIYPSREQARCGKLNKETVRKVRITTID